MKQFEDIFITAFEQGSSYWAEVKDATPSGSGSNSERWFNHILQGGSMDVYDAEIDELLGSVTKEKFAEAVELMALEQYDFDAEDFDAEDADVWFQFVVIGEITFA